METCRMAFRTGRDFPGLVEMQLFAALVTDQGAGAGDFAGMVDRCPLGIFLYL